MNSYANVSFIRPFAHTKKLVVSLALLLYALLAMGLIENSSGLFAYALLLMGYVYAEAKNLWVCERHLFWINPVILATLSTFVMGFGISNILYLLPEDTLAILGIDPYVTLWMNHLMLLVVMGAVAMWAGYGSGLGRALGIKWQRSQLLHKWISTSSLVNKPAIYAFLAISLTMRLWAVKLGIYGYSAYYDNLISAQNYTQYFSLGASLGQLVLVGMALQCFSSSNSSLLDRALLWSLVGIEVTSGFLSGFKSTVVMPMIIVGVVYYTQRNRFPRWLVPAVLVGIMTAYAVIEPFRIARYEDAGFVETDLNNIASTMYSAYRDSISINNPETPSWVLRFLSRSNLTYIGSLGIEYAASGELPSESPAFLGDIILAPAHAIIPRFLWESKSLQNIGLWYSREVMGNRLSISSTGMSPFTYLNFAGGPLAVILIFFVVGALQRALFDGLSHRDGGGLMILLGLLGTLGTIDSAVNSFFIGIIRNLPILIIAQYILLRRSNQQGVREEQLP